MIAYEINQILKTYWNRSVSLYSCFQTNWGI